MNARLATLALCLFAASPVFAEKADRNKPMMLEASRASIDDARKVQVLEGDVVITKGTMVLKADRVVISEDAYGFQKGVAYAGKNGLARFRQKQEGKESYVEGEAERIEYDTNKEVAELFHRAWIKSGEDVIRGDYIWYDSISEKYLVTAGDAKDARGAPPRVRAIIQPKTREEPAAQDAAERRAPPLELKGAGDLKAPAPSKP